MTTNTNPYITDVLPEITVTFSHTVPAAKRTQIRSSRDAHNIFRSIWDEGTMEYKEQFFVLCLSRSNRVLGYFLHSIGGLSGTVVDTKQILAVAIKANAASIILCHNHPSGNSNPSTTDRDLTRKIIRAATLLDVGVLDHLVITDETYYSFADEGILPVQDVYDAKKVKEYIAV